ncbi:LOW QUALITY PROTEIN: cytoplasmic dynein 1 heavy chain 1-like [Gigantopelta aegis]|uniref:LOW QUALITY PROTEIN: cytoplasmic dynein 1 heavy chain 1-like n=1 Tax=Gigantopelta aegis TaxID=1735272 RepID=UPI001B88AE5E|nr:LOW QUALITY PROTEIN: cytoplasmic dynein 1 heavy chain 1-like [Gigantopelta aegis]
MAETTDQDQSVQSVADTSEFLGYIRRVVPVLLDDDDPDLAALQKAVSDKQTIEVIKKFLSDSQCPTLLIQRTSTKDEVAEGGAEVEGTTTYTITTGVQFISSKVASMVLVKRGPIVEADKGFPSQLRVMNFSEGSPYETLHAYVSNAMGPYFKSYIRETGKAERDGDKMAPTVEKKIAELEMGLLHLQQNIDIPEITLPINPVVSSVIKKCSEENRKAKVEDFGDKVEDAQFLNSLQSGVNRWIREIQKVTKLDRDPASGTALQEISFWLNLERALLRIQEKRESIEVVLTLDILKHGKRFHATVSFDTDTGLKQAMATVNDYNQLMKDFPINDLLSATELDRIRIALQGIFIHLRKIRPTKYPIQRALKLVEAISRDLQTQLLKVLGTRRLMHIPYDEFEKVLSACFEVFTMWDDEYDKLQGMLRDLVKKKREEHLRMVWRINPVHKKLQARLDHMRRFRHQHEQLRSVIMRVLRPSTSKGRAGTPMVEEPDNKDPLVDEAADVNAIEEVNLAYENVKEVDVVDTSKEGAEAWEAAIKRYDERIDRVETRITARLRDQLGTARNANEMFRIFSRFNALFVRPHIRGAIREYQTQLIQRVKDDIESLHEKFKVQYAQSKACRMSKVRDLPPVSGSIIWARQIERQLNAFMQRVEDVLGKGWENHVEGQKLKNDGDSFRAKLNTQDLFEDWTRKVTNRQLNVVGMIFEIVSQRQANKGNVLRLVVNFQREIIQLSKEVRNLRWLGFRVPLAIVNKAHQANQLYPFAISLIESVRTYEGTLEKVAAKPSISLLLAGLRKEVQNLVADGCALVWESYKLDPYVQRLADTVFNFQEKVDDLLVMEEEIALELRALETCAYNASTFREILSKIQKSVDNLSLHAFSNLPQWVSKLDEEVENQLAVRLEAGLDAWTKCLLGKKEEEQMESYMDTDTEPKQVGHKLGGEPQIKPFIHELRITNQLIYVSPPVVQARSNIMQELFAWEAVITSLPRIQHSRYQVGLEAESASETAYRNVLTKLPQGSLILEDAYSAIEKIVLEFNNYVTVWLRYQSLWDLNPDVLYGRLGSNLTLWMSTLEEIKASRKTFDTSETAKEIGPIVVQFLKVQSKVTLKYDSWHKEVLTKFGSLLGNEMSEFHAQISKSRSDLEQQSIDTANTSEAVGLITHVQSLKRKMKNWEKQVDMYKEGQRILERQRFQFPSNWLYIDNVDGEWGAFGDIMKRKDSSIQTQVASLQMKIVSEDKVVESKTHDLLTDWEKEKPVEGEIRPDEAIKALTIFEGKFCRLKEERDNVSKAKEALELAEPGQVSPSEERVQVALEELQDLKGVWSELAKIWEQIDELKEKPWLSVAPRKLRQSIDGLLSQLKELPARLRAYGSYEHVKKALQGYAKVNVIIVELKSEALKERHWKQLMRRLGVNWVLSELTLGHIWDINLQKHEQIVRDVIMVAQGEMALEEFLKQVSEVWRSYELDLISYQNKCRLIRGWDELFTKVKEHINSVTAMKLSPYYKQFEEEAQSWEDKLNRINALFDVWIDVQRRWVYLEGIFTGSADIKHLLPVETTRFQGVSTEFLGLMKKVTRSPLVMDVLNISNVQRQLERLADLLGKIQKALGEYLERERASFPRFYFVGDEDLLEIIGNSKNVPRLQKHFKKMFAGVYSIVLNEDDSQVKGLMSKEGEEVVFASAVSIAAHPKINEWLTLTEKEMRVTLAKLLASAIVDMTAFKSGQIETQKYIEWVDKYLSQLVVLAAQISWSESVEAALQNIANSGKPDITPLKDVLRSVESTLNVLADMVLYEQPPVRRKKLESLITELVHQRDITRMLVKHNVISPKSFDWLSQMRFYFDPKNSDVLQQLSIQMANAKFNYGFEYLGVQDKLVQTPLTDRCYLTMTQALEARLGGSPFGPAGTGKTESVKALGNQLGRFVLVFNCDETFDFQAMGRIFVGLCQVGAWGCFDEFNRLEERMLSAVSQQIQTIQEALKEMCDPERKTEKGVPPITAEIIGKQVKVNADMAIFITMNPGYAGRSNLPDNLKKLFRSLAMNKPDRQLIAQVMLYSQGFRMAEKLASKIVPFFKLCDEQLSPQSHYDFGLRALKSVLVSAGNIKRECIQKVKEDIVERGETVDETSIAENLPEQEILIQSVMETMVPKLVAEDIPLLHSLLSDVFPGVQYTPNMMKALRKEIKKVCEEMHLSYGEGDEQGAHWVDKVLQLYQITLLHHGLMMVGPSGSGKSTAWQVLLKALERLNGIEGVAHVIDPKSISKEALYGNLDPNTREWTDGLFTHILRKIIDNVRGELSKVQWIIFDGDVDPEWVENLNSVLDDNKLLTLPNGERLGIPPNVRIMFEVQDLKFATLATVSRCGMVWFSEDVLSTDMIFDYYLQKLMYVPVEESEDDTWRRMGGGGDGKDDLLSPTLRIQQDAKAVFTPFFASNGLINKSIEYAATLEHVMDFTRLRALTSLFSLLNQGVRNVIAYNRNHCDFPMQQDQMERYLSKYLIYSLIWSMSGDGRIKMRQDLGDFIRGTTTVPLPPSNMSIIDFEVAISGEWQPWTAKVPQVEVETHKVASPDVVIPTIDTVRHESLLYTWLAEHKPLVLCGPPGSGKTMTLFSALRALPDMEVVGLNFSSATTPELLLKTFDHYCEFRRTPNGVVLSPIQLNKWLILFCDEINLPDMDKYGTQRVISFLRQLMEQGGFYRTSDQTFVKFERIQFVGACNPPTDPGRKPLSHRFLRHVPVVYVDYPGETSLKQIYGTFNRAMLRLVPSLKPYAEPLTNAMVEFYMKSQDRFTQDMQPHYVYSPREMTRWVRGICEALRPLESLPIEGLVRIYVHEALRLFQDRLIEDDERLWTDQNVDMVALKHFPNINRDEALTRPILFSNWLSKDYIPVDREELREYTKARLKVFYEEELDVPLVLFDEVLDHVLRIDRIFRQPQGHLLLIGVSGAGKTTLSRFVAWMNGLTVYQIKVHNKYTAFDFDEDLRIVLRRSGCKDEKMCFIMDESNVLDSSFLERMNTLLANGEVPGLFEGDEYTTLMTQCKEGAQREGLMLDSGEELYKWFTQQVLKNLHVVFTMNPSSEGLKDRAATSPALFNRCVLNWFGDWSTGALYQVGREFTNKIDLERGNYMPPGNFPIAYENLPMPPCHRDAVVNAFCFVHISLYQANARVARRGGRVMAITPRHYLDFIHHFAKLYHEKRSDLEEQQLHLNVGLHKIHETVDQVEELQKSLSIKRIELEEKNAAANAKLKQMVKDQQEAERKKVTSQEIQQALKDQTAIIQEKKAFVKEDLAKVEPAVIEAQQAVKSIKKQHLVEVRSLANPPAAVKMAVESICDLLGEADLDWKAQRGILMRDNFISTIVNFTTDDITDEIRTKMKTKYLTNPDYNYEKVNRASLACGPMVKWAIAQISYADMLKRVEPLRNELLALENQAKENRMKGDEVNKLVVELERSIAKYKEEYAMLISQAQAIKADLASVEAKVQRSVSLLSSLSSEKQRWEAGSETFKNQMATIIGDVLLSSAFMAYAGYFDQSMRRNLFSMWCNQLQQSSLHYRQDLARTEYLSNPDERLRWQANDLPTDDLCTENAIMLKRFNRYPLIIDPSGQATNFLLKEFKEKKITKTSFLDDAFRKNLESALRFGNPLLVQDVENYDPILNPVLNRELRRTGGRVLITLGDQDIDLSPSFTIFLSTRDPNVEFPPDICSRVTFVNFTVTRSSLHSQCLNQVLKSERPDVDEKRSDLLKLQGEFQLRLRQLEKSLLQALNDVKGKILDDDRILSHLETLKTEAAEVARKVEETDVVMAEVERVSQQYMPLAKSCSSIYFTQEALKQVHFLYQYSLHFFLEIFHDVLKCSALKNVKEYAPRLSIITKELFKETYSRVGRGMLHEDRITFGIQLCRIHLQGMSSESTYTEEFNHFLRSQENLLTGKPSSSIQGLNPQQQANLVRLSKMPAFRMLGKNIQANMKWLDSDHPELEVPQLWEKELSPIGQAVYGLLVVQAFRPDRLVAMARVFVEKTLGTEFVHAAEKELNLSEVVENEIKANTPVLMCSMPGFDASGRVDDLAAELGKQLTSVAIGSAEGFTQAEKVINSSSKSGRWVMLKNVHLAPQWLIQLEKKVHNLTPHTNFRLFLTMEINSKLPTNLLRAGRVVVFEPPPGVPANLTRTFSSVPAARMCKAPNERARLYFLLAWLHAIIQERMRYTPLGWSKKYEYTESDLKVACDMLDVWINSVAKGRTNLPPEKVPWDAIRTLLSQCIYGGKIDNEFDQRLLNAFVAKLFTPKSFEGDFKLVTNVDGQEGKHIVMPDGVRREQFIQFVDNMEDRQTPSWLGLPNNAENVLMTTYGSNMIAKLMKMQLLEDDDIIPDADSDPETKKLADGRPAWIRTLHGSVTTWLQLVPQPSEAVTLGALKRTVENIKDPLFRFFEREVNAGARLLHDVRQDMEDVMKVCQGEKKPTNHHRSMMADLVKGIIPNFWRRYNVPGVLTVIQWITDFSERIKQLQKIVHSTQANGTKELKNLNVWLGGLFIPEAYITATRQYVAQANSWSLEELYLDVTVTGGKSGSLDACSFGVTGLKLQGAVCQQNKLQLSSTISTDLPLTLLRWIRNDGSDPSKSKVVLPVYLNATREQLLFTLDFESVDGPEAKGYSFYERGVAIITSDLN